MYKQLFDRFESGQEGDMSHLAYDIADILGARRAIEQDNIPGVLNWGLPAMAGLSPQVESDRKIVAEHMQEALHRFEPRLSSVEVIPVEGSNDFAFQLHAELADEENEAITLRILTPRRGGGLGAEVVVVGGAGETAVLLDESAENLVNSF